LIIQIGHILILDLRELNVLACRNCRVNIAASAGCAICNPIRKHLVVVGEDEDERPSLSVASNEIVAAMRQQLKEVRRATISEDPKVKGGAEARLIAIANSMSKVLESARKLQVDGISAVENMSFPERAELFISWITDLPPAYRAALREKWDNWETETSAPLSELTIKVIGDNNDNTSKGAAGRNS